MPETEQYVSAVQAAKLVGVNERTIRLWVEKGALPASHPASNRLAIPMSAITRVIRERAEREALDQIPTPREMARQLEAVQSELETIRHVAERGAATIDDRDSNRVEDKIDALEIRLSRLEALYASAPRVGAERHTDNRPRVRIAEEYQLPKGAILLRDFAKEYGVPYPTARDHALVGIGRGQYKDYLEVSARPKPGRPKETERFLTPEQQALALEYWRRHHVPYHNPPDTPDDDTEGA